uniref:Uncharacterized protein n=1 Tax=Yersinia enterocolitica TaxID=630 RepID=F2Q858_YEREN|nr:hypothetical protein Y69_0018 [Yersinia enterocolitica]
MSMSPEEYRSGLQGIKYFKWLAKARSALEGMVPHSSRNIGEKLVHLKDIKSFEKDLNQLRMLNGLGGKNVQITSSDPDLLFKAQLLHDTVLVSLQSIYKSTYNHRYDKIKRLFNLLYEIEMKIGCHHRLIDSGFYAPCPLLVRSSGEFLYPIAKLKTQKGYIPMTQGTEKRRVGVCYPGGYPN